MEVTSDLWWGQGLCQSKPLNDCVERAAPAPSAPAQKQYLNKT